MSDLTKEIEMVWRPLPWWIGALELILTFQKSGLVRACRARYLGVRTGVRIVFYPTRAVSTAQGSSLFPRQWPSVPSGKLSPSNRRLLERKDTWLQKKQIAIALKP